MANDAMAERFVQEQGEKRDRKQEALTRNRNLGRQTPLQKKSFKQKLLDMKWAGIKEDRIFMLEMLDPIGAHCETCGVPGNADTLDLDHLQPRGKGGEWQARNAGLKCNYKHPSGNDCHGNKHGKPQWSDPRD